MICENLSVNSCGHLTFAGLDCVELAAKYGTPLYVMDENRIRHNCRVYMNAMKKYFGENSACLYASKACSFKRLYEIIKEEGFGTDVVSSGEVYTALKADFDLGNAFFHSNNKTDEDIAFAIDSGIGYFVCDNIEEVYSISAIAGEKGVKQKVLLRLTPGIDPHTYEAVNTGKVDSKFGSAIETGQAFEITKTTLGLPNIDLRGFHCHIGSQIFDSEIYIRGSEIMLEFIAHVRQNLGYTAEILDLGGGYGVRYIEANPYIDIDSNIKGLADFIKRTVAQLAIPMPRICLEPGRSIVADAGLTLYTAGTVKRIPGYKNYVSIDGGMADNPRYALYGSYYTVMSALRPEAQCDMHCTLAGRCCESGDLIQENIFLPSDIKRGEIIAVLTTGAYNYSMSSNYNRLGKPAVVMIADGKDYVAVKRETLDDIIRNDV
ncbi:MAG: diaminopimelate decarboxylase [Ruminococcaceae bacterium]|nr:diaminopimelate decarboxylase [Oscillospiraceae bacterium]MBR3598031.1 diaminopimelate decarboxylase [Clostridia bacterium]